MMLKTLSKSFLVFLYDFFILKNWIWNSRFSRGPFYYFFHKWKFFLSKFQCHKDTWFKLRSTPVGINEKGFVNSDFGIFLLLDYCIENERGSVGMPLCRVLINISSKSSKIVYLINNFWRFGWNVDQYPTQRRTYRPPLIFYAVI